MTQEKEKTFPIVQPATSEKQNLTVRLYVGGLTEQTTREDVEKRFTPFGNVEQVDLMPAKISAQPSTFCCRGFGYVTFKPKDERSLSRCLSLYNGCVWRGNKLRVEKAKPDYKSLFEAEKALETSSDDGDSFENHEPEPIFAREDAHSLILQVEGRLGKRHPVPLQPKHTPLTHKKYFPPMKDVAPESLSWDPVPHSYTRRELQQVAAARAAEAASAGGAAGRKAPRPGRDKARRPQADRSAPREGAGPAPKRPRVGRAPEPTGTASRDAEPSPPPRPIPKPLSGVAAAPHGGGLQRGGIVGGSGPAPGDSSDSEDYAALRARLAARGGFARLGAGGEEDEEEGFEVVSARAD
uniref:Hsp27-ere-tata-binding protein scaffold attachment factor (Saf-b) n=1 Tax=Tetraselmis sp. GSL018 TaxID=582737 RepID=A0A061S076_9CHLO